MINFEKIYFKSYYIYLLFLQLLYEDLWNNGEHQVSLSLPFWHFK